MYVWRGKGLKRNTVLTTDYVDVQVVLICVDDSVTIYVEVPVCSYDIPVSVRMYVSPPPPNDLSDVAIKNLTAGSFL